MNNNNSNRVVVVGDQEEIAEEINNKKGGIFERINKRNKDRQNDLEVKTEQRNKENEEMEGVDYFSQSFTVRTRDIELRLRNINETAASNKPSGDLLDIFTNITLQIQELQRYLTASTMFLSDYKIKACQTILTELQHSSEETRLRLLPKKKFGFSGKKVAPKVTLNPKVSGKRQDLIDGDPQNAAVKTSSSEAFSWTLSNRKDEYICLSGEAVNGKDITMSNLVNCFIELQGHAGSVQLNKTRDCTLLCGPVARSLFAEYCERLTLAVACQQLRLHSSNDCRLYLHVTCRAVIEDCHGIELSTYAYDYENLAVDYEASGLNPAINNYTDVADFNWLSPDVASPNWKLMSSQCAPPDWKDLRQTFLTHNNIKNLLNC